jgi:hypothetical protein
LLLSFALIPVAGDAITGVGKLVIKAAANGSYAPRLLREALLTSVHPMEQVAGSVGQPGGEAVERDLPVFGNEA